MPRCNALWRPHTQYVRREGPHLLSRNAVGGAARLVSNFGNDRSACGIRKEGEVSPCSFLFGLLGLLFFFFFFSRTVCGLTQPRSSAWGRPHYPLTSSHVGGPELPNLVHQQRRLWASRSHWWVTFGSLASHKCSLAKHKRLSSFFGGGGRRCVGRAEGIFPRSVAGRQPRRWVHCVESTRRSEPGSAVTPKS